MVEKVKIQKEPVCIWYNGLNGIGCELHFHEDFPSSTFDEFCLYVLIPRIKDLQEEGHGVRWGYVADGGQTLEEFEKTMIHMLTPR